MANLSNINNKLLVGTNGEVRIGDTATVANVKLRVKQTAQQWTAQFVNTDSSVAYGISIDTSASSYGVAGTLQCYTNTGGGFIVRNDSKVGIGTDSPTTFLQVSGQGNRAGGNIQMGLSSQGASKWSYLTGTHYNSTTEPEGFALIGGYSDIDENRVVIGGDIWETNPATSIHFWTHSSSTHAQGGTQRMVINSSGNVLLGNTVVNPASGFSNQRGLGYNNSTGNLEVASTTGTPMTIGRNETAAGEILQLRKESNITHSFGSTDSYLLSNVGIGTTSPSGKLTISDANATGLEINPLDSQNRVNIMAYDRADSAYREINFDGSNYNFEIANSTKLVINSSGNVIQSGTSPQYQFVTPNNYNFQIAVQENVSNALEITPSTAAGGTTFSTPAVVINSSGNVGIGTTSPARLLTIEDGAGGGDPTDSRTKLYINGSAEAYMSFNVPANQYMGIRYAIAGTNKAFMEFEDPNNYLRIGTVSADSIVFATTNSTKMVILPGGNVGIGTTSPTAKLTIDNNISQTYYTTGYAATPAFSMLYLNNTNGGSDTASLINFRTGTGDGVLGFVEGGGTNDADFIIQTDGGSNGIERFRITNAGNVGIGTTSPAAALDIKHASVPLITRSTNNNAIAMFNEISGGYSHLYLYQINAGARVAISTNGNSYFNGGSVGIGTTPETGTLLHLEKNSAANTVTELLRLDCGENSHAAGKGGKIVFRDINVYNDTATIEAVRLSASSGSTLNFRLRNSANGPILALRSDHIAQFQGTSTSDIIKINSGTGLNANVGMIIFQDNSNNYLGQITANSATTTTSYLSASDYRLKEDLKDFNGLDLVSNIKVYDFKWKAADERTYGVIAHELNEVIPQAVDGEKDAERMQSADYSKIVPVLVKAIQELKAEIELLKSK